MTNKEIIQQLRIIQTSYSEIRKDDAAFNAIEEAIEKISHSYDLDAVLEQLEEKYEEAQERLKNSYDFYYDGAAGAYDIAEQIVRAGIK